MKNTKYILPILSLVLLASCNGNQTSEEPSNSQSSSMSEVSSSTSSEPASSTSQGSPIESLIAKYQSINLKVKQATEAATYYTISGVNGAALGASKRKCNITSSNTSIAKITGNGVNGDPYMIVGVSAGTATIDVVSVVDPTKSCAFNVEVSESFFDLDVSNYHDGDYFDHDSGDPETGIKEFRSSSRTTGSFFFRGANSTKFYLESTLVVNGTYDIPLAPKFGLICATMKQDGTLTNNRFVFELNAEVGTVGDYWDYYGCAEGKDDIWGWTQGIPNDSARHADKMWYDDHTVTYDQPFKMGMIRDGLNFHMFVDDKYIGTAVCLASLFEVDGEPVRTRFGLFEFMSDVTYSNYSWTQDSDEVDAKIAQIEEIKEIEWDAD